MAPPGVLASTLAIPALPAGVVAVIVVAFTTSLNRRAHQTMEERHMNEGIEQFLATIIEQSLGEHDMQPPLVVRTVGDNGSVLVAGINEGAELVVLTKHCENDT